MGGLFFWFVFFTPDAVYKAKAVFVMVLDRTTEIIFSSHLTTKTIFIKQKKGLLGYPLYYNIGKHGNTLVSHLLQDLNVSGSNLDTA